MKNLTKTTITVISILVISIFFIQCKDAKKVAITKFLEVQVKTINDQCPIQLNQSVRIDSCKVSDKMTMKTFATISYINANDFNTEEFIQMSKPALLYTIQTNDALKLAREQGVIFTYSYNDDSGKTLGEITIGPDEYNQPIKENDKGDFTSMSSLDADNLLDKIVSGIRQHLPMQVDEITVLTDCQSLSNKTIKYVYTINADKKELNADFAEQMKKNIKNNIINVPDSKKLIDGGVTMIHIYNDKNGIEICNLNLSSKDL